ncbi:MAG: OFA family MFS transporter [Planctomycetes bacterium]|jgi:MFS family permease|nr:OFA family MFS transporter [Planctomycetota bacterium]
MTATAPPVPSPHAGRTVTLAATGINLALGILYTWSVLKAAIAKEWGWNASETALPYSVACLVFAFSTVLAGRLQDRMGPRRIATAGGILVGAGCLLAGFLGNSVIGFVAGFGVLAGTGIGFGYASATPPAVKWFPPHRTGLVAGVVVAGFGLASVLWAPLATALLGGFGTAKTMIILGVVFVAAVVVLAQFLRNPPAGYVPGGAAPGGAAKRKVAARDCGPKEMLRAPRFWLLWTMFFFGAGVGLMLIGTATKFGKTALGEANAFWLVVVLAVGNAGGRVLAGSLSDRIGRLWTLFAAFTCQALMVLALVFITDEALVLMGVVLVAGANYGANLSLFPAAAKDSWGLRNFGLNYGLLFTAWGLGGFALSQVNGLLTDAFPESGHRLSLYLAAGLLVLGAALTFVSRAVDRRPGADPVATGDGPPH